MTSNLRPLASALALSLASALPIPALAADFRPADAKPVTTTDIQLVQQAALVVPRDRITATLRVILRGPNARQIQVEINRRMVAALAKVKNAPAVIAETGSYAVNHPYTREGQESAWQGEQTITLTSGDIDAVLNLAGDLQNDGLVMGEMRFFVSPDSLKAVQDDLTATALKAMQDRAANIAGDLNLKVERYKTITVGNAQEQIGETPTTTKGAPAGQSRKAPPPAAIAGEALVTLTVNSTVMVGQ
ncbi:MAG TPA: SIMPL domain-containing protein [Rhizomicrobium sp.]|jgi:predicted secreted protein|nr:SIMPL domain-containing protein [Rhizomicrobium sp.]